MFDSFEAFSTVYWILALVLFFLILYEKRLIALEEKRRKARRKHIEELKRENSVQRFIIVALAEKLSELKSKHGALERINETNLEDLRRERMKNREVKE